MFLGNSSAWAPGVGKMGINVTKATQRVFVLNKEGGGEDLYKQVLSAHTHTNSEGHKLREGLRHVAGV